MLQFKVFFKINSHNSTTSGVYICGIPLQLLGQETPIKMGGYFMFDLNLGKTVHRSQWERNKFTDKNGPRKNFEYQPP